MDLVALAPSWAALVFIALMLLAALQDATQLKISNILIATLLVLAVVAAAIIGPTWSLWQNVAAFASVLAFGTWLFGNGMMGGGDVKLSAVAALWFDLASNFSMLVAVAIIGGLLAFSLILARSFSTGKRAETVLAGSRQSGEIPYGVAIAGGAILTAVSSWPGRL